MLNIILAEDHVVVRDGIKMLLETDDNILIVGEANNGLAVLEMLKGGMKVDIILSDVYMPEIDGISLIRKVHSSHPNIKVILLSMMEDVKYVTTALAEGASGYLLKDIDIEELLFAIKQVSNGKKHLSTALAINLLDKAVRDDRQGQQFTADEEFSERELEILQLIGEGMTNNEMSDALFISKRTIEGHRQSLILKTGAKNTATLIKYAVQHHLIF